MRFKSDLSKPNRKFKYFYYKNLGKVRVQIDSNGRPWFCFTDICNILKIKEPQKMLDYVDIPYHFNLTVVERDGLSESYVLASFISKEGLHQALRIRRREIEIQMFMEWIENKVIPKIHYRKSYHKKDTITNHERNLTIGELLVKYENKINSLMKENKELKDKLSAYESCKRKDD